MNNIEAEVIRNYKNPSHPTAFSGLQNVYRYYNKRISLKKIRDILSKVDEYTLHKEYKQLTTNPNYVNYARQQFQIDVAFLNELSRFNDGIKYLLVCIDSFTKFAFVRGMVDKTARSTLNCFISILNQARKKPQIIVSDRGLEFMNQEFLNFCRGHGMKLINNYTSTHAPIAERFIRTLKKLITKYLTSTNQKRYIDELQNLIQSYNTRFHNTIKMAPYEAEKPSSALKIRLALSKNSHRRKIRKVNPKLQIGQKVRIALTRKKFSRGHHPKFSKEIHTIYMIKTKLPIPMYYVKNEKNEKLPGGFYAYQLAPVQHTVVNNTNISENEEG